MNGHNTKEKLELSEINEKEFHKLIDPFQDVPATFEEAIEKTGFGKFNYMLIFMVIPGNLSTVLETTTLSYVFAPAQCDLHLSLQDKGFLNAITFAGMISSALVWGMLLDRFGRKKLMVLGYFLDGLCALAAAFSKSIEVLIVCKFLGGLIINGPFAAMISYLGEFHSNKYRSRIQLISGSYISLGQILCPLLAWITLPLVIEWSFFNGYIGLHSWNVYLITCSLVPILSSILLMFLPESPKFLMSKGENNKALRVLQKVYSINTGKPRESFPITQLIVEKELVEKAKQSLIKSVFEEFKHLGPLFKQPLLFKFFLIAGTQTLCLTGLNMLRLWSPQIFQAMQDYKLYNNGTTTKLCTMLEVLQPHSSNGTCTTNVDTKVYFNAIIVAVTGMIGFFICVTFINKVGKKRTLIVLAWSAAISGTSIFFAQGVISTTVLITLFNAFGTITNNLTLTIGVDVFPTKLRAFVISMIMATARTGGMIGNLIYPLLLSIGCGPPFFAVGGIFAVAGVLALFLPNTERRALA